MPGAKKSHNKKKPCKKSKKQTVESILKAAEDAKKTSEALNAKGKELGEIAKARRKKYEEKQ
jgi:hypothetical protein